MHILSKRSLLCSLVMLILFVLIIYCVLQTTAFPANAFVVQNKDTTKFLDPDKELKSVYIIFRHGARTPADTYPNDPYINETFSPYGWGQLTNKGKVSLFEMGKWLRERYNHFLGDLYSSDFFHAQSTGVSRTKMSLELVLAGLWPPKKTALEWNKELNWQPIPYDYEELDSDTLLLVRKSCPRYYEELQRVMREEDEIINLLDTNQQLFQELTNITGMKISDPEELQSLFSTLKAEEDFGLKLPSWCDKYYPHKMIDIVEKSYIFNVYNDELKMIKGGPFIKKMLNDWNGKKLNKNGKKFYMYAGHDSTIVNILSALNIWEQQIPDYGIMGIFELYKEKNTDEWGVKTYVKTVTQTKPKQLKIPGCDEFCNLEKLIQLTENIIPNDNENICKPYLDDFTEPPLSGP